MLQNEQLRFCVVSVWDAGNGRIIHILLNLDSSVFTPCLLTLNTTPSKKTEQVEPMPSTSRDDPSPSTSQVDKVISVKEHLDSSHPNVPYTDIARQLEYFRVVASNLSGYAEWMESQFVNYLRENHLDAMKGNASSLSFPFQIQNASNKIKRPRGRPKKTQ